MASLLHSGGITRVRDGLGQRPGWALSGAWVTIAVFLSKSTLMALTPDNFSSAFLTVIGHSSHVMFFTSSVTGHRGAPDWRGKYPSLIAQARVESSLYREAR